MSDKRANDRLILGAPPRADLLPPELKAIERLRAQRRGLVGVALFAIALVAAGYVYALLNAQSAALNLAAADAQTQLLLDQKNEYVEVRQLADQVETIKFLRRAAVYQEIDWTAYLVTVQASLPAGTKLSSVSAVLTDPSEIPSSPLLNPSVAQLTFTATTGTLPQVSAWVDSLSLLSGFADATPGEIARNDNGSYSVTIIMHITADALAHRFSGDEDDATTEDDTTTEETN